MGFVVVVLLGVALIHFYLWKRLVHDPMRPGLGRRAGTTVAVLLGLLVPVTLIGVRNGYFPWLSWPGYLWVALMFYLLVTLAVLELPRLALMRLWAAPRRTAQGSARGAAVTETAQPDPTPAVTESAQPDPTPTVTGTDQPDRKPGVDRRLVLARGAAIFAGLTAAGVTGYGVRTATGAPRIDRFTMPMSKLPRAMDGTRLAVVSDIHIGPLTGVDHAQRIVRVINSVDADVVCVVGDLVDGSVAQLGRFAAPLAGIESRRGAYFVTGNHEYYSGYQEWVDEVADLGMRPLRNDRVEIDGLDLAGVNDVNGAEYGDAPDYARALGDRDPARPVVLMAHQPVAAEEAAAFGVDLQVSGHTHGGQMVPFNLLVRLAQPVVSGFGNVDGVPVYVTNGAGSWGPPVRVGAPPQVTVIELRVA